MRLPVFALFALVASGCTIHVVEQPATPVLIAAAPPPTFERPAPAHRVAYEPVAAPSTPRRPRRNAPRAAASPPAVPAPRAARPSLVPFKAAASETRNTHLARVAPPARKHPPHKSKRPEPLTHVTSASVAKAQ